MCFPTCTNGQCDRLGEYPRSNALFHPLAMAYWKARPGPAVSFRIPQSPREVNMKRNFFGVVIVVVGLSAFITVCAEHAAAQGPAGAGASAASQQSSHSSHSLNPIKWVKKDSKKFVDSNGSRSDVEKKLTTKLQSQRFLHAYEYANDASVT